MKETRNHHRSKTWTTESHRYGWELRANAVEAGEAAPRFTVMLINRLSRRLRSSNCGLAAERER